ncbi:hypothetical protein H0H92_010687 [Tricholoma furcatifolium]|nr:hypothetical protein H0H92_010687 [Tricholoma furcatifolium]
MGEFSDLVIRFSSNLLARSAPEQGGVISGSNPATYNSLDPFPLWVIQLSTSFYMIFGGSANGSAQ